METLTHMVGKTWAYFWHPESKYVLAIFVALTLLVIRQLPGEVRRVRNTVLLFSVCVGGQLGSALLEAVEYSRLATMLHELFVIGSGFAVLRMAGLFAFRAILPRVGVTVVSIAEDISLFAAYGAFVIIRLHFIGLDPSSLLTTSAVITAVLAFAMQDTLGNVLVTKHILHS